MIASFIIKNDNELGSFKEIKDNRLLKNELFKIVKTTLIGIVIDFVFLMDEQRHWFFTTNFNILIPISLQPDGVNL